MRGLTGGPEELYHLTSMGLTTHTNAHTHAHATLHALDFIWGLSASHAIPSGKKWSQSESRWEVRPGVQALHLSSVIKTGTLGPSHPIEEKMERERERGSADPGLLLLSLEICEAWLTPSPCPIYIYLWNTSYVTHYALKFSPHLKSITLMLLKVTSDAVWSMFYTDFIR